MKPKQRIGISILIQKNSDHNNFSLIKREKNDHKTQFNEAKKNMENSTIMDASLHIQKPLSLPPSSIFIDELAHIQKEDFQNNNLDSFRTTTTISPPHEKNPLSIDREVLKFDNKSDETNYTTQSCDLKTLNAIDKRLHDIPFSCSKIMCSNCKGNSINVFKSHDETIEDDRIFDRNLQCMLEYSKESCLNSQPNELSNQKNHTEGGREGILYDKGKIYNTYFEPANNTKFSHPNSKSNSSLHLLKANVKDPTKTIDDVDDEVNTTIGIQNFKSNHELPHLLKKEHNYEDEVFNNPIHLDVPPMQLHKIDCYNKNNLKEKEKIQSSNAIDVQLNFDRNEISSLSCFKCSTQQDEVNFPCFVKLPNNPTCTIKHVNDIIPKQHFCSTLDHCRDSCNINMKYNSCKSSLLHNFKNELEFSTISNTKTIEHSDNLNNECKPHINFASKDDDEKCKNIKEIFHINDIQQYSQALEECNRSITQSETTLYIGTKNDVDISCSIRAYVPSMICAQAVYILEKKKETLAVEKTIVENLIHKGDSQHELINQLMFIFRSKLGEYKKLCLEIQNLAKKVSNDEIHFQLLQYREDKQNK